MPSIAWPDEWWLGWSATRFIRGELVFGPLDSPEPLFIWITGIAFKAFGEDIVVARAVSASVGSLTVPLAWWAFKPATGPRPALWIAACLAVSRWHILISRIAMQYVLVPFLVLLALGTIVRAVRTDRTRWWVAGGVVAGLAPYSYAAARFIPVAAILAVLFSLATGEARRGKWRGPALGLAAMFVVLAPLAMHFHAEPASFSRRFGVLSQEFFADPVRRGMGNLSAFLPGFFLRGDPFATSSFPNPAGTPMLGWFGGALAAAGLGLAFRGLGAFAGGYLLAFGGAMALTAAITGWGWPSGMLRSSGLLALVALLQGSVLFRLSGISGGGPPAALALFVLLAGTEAPRFLVPAMRQAGTGELLAGAPRHNVMLADKLAKMAGKRPVYPSPDSLLYQLPTETLLGTLRFHSGLDVRGIPPSDLRGLKRDRGLCIFVCPNQGRRGFVEQAFPGVEVIDGEEVPCLKRGPAVAVADSRIRGVVTLEEFRLAAQAVLSAEHDIDSGNDASAVARLERFSTYWPDLALPHSIRASSLCAIGSKDEGRREAEEALRLSGGRDARALIVLGFLEIEGSRYRAAERYLRKALALEPCQEIGWYNLAVALRRMGRPNPPEGLRYLPDSRMLREIYGGR